MDVRCLVNTLGTFECFIEMKFAYKEKKNICDGLLMVVGI
jgi:hypothetical protein